MKIINTTVAILVLIFSSSLFAEVTTPNIIKAPPPAPVKPIPQVHWESPGANSGLNSNSSDCRPVNNGDGTQKNCGTDGAPSGDAANRRY